MKIAATQYNLQDRALEIYLSGCKGPHCAGCHNPELWDYFTGKPVTEALSGIKAKIRREISMIDQVWILGGEPLDQDIDMLAFFISALPPSMPVTLFTRYELDTVPDEIKCIVNYIKTGPYVCELASDTYYDKGMKLASTNQKLHRHGVDFF